MSVQASILGDTDTADQLATIHTDGRVIRPWLDLITAIDAEARLTINEDGLHTKLVDPANVAALQTTLHATAFDSYELHREDTIGLGISDLQSTLSDARKGKRTRDPVDLGINTRHIRSTIQREYDQTTVTRTDETLTVDTGKLRDTPSPPDLDLDYQAEIDTPALRDVVMHIDKNHVYVSELDGHLVIRTDMDDAGDCVADFGPIATERTDDPTAGAESQFSIDHLKDIAGGLADAYTDHVTLRWDQEFPLGIEFEHTDEDDNTVYSGVYHLAPRIQKGDE